MRPHPVRRGGADCRPEAEPLMKIRCRGRAGSGAGKRAYADCQSVRARCASVSSECPDSLPPLRRHREDLLALSLSQQDLAAALLDLFLLPDGYRVALGNLSQAQSARLFPLYLNLLGPSSSRDATVLMEIRRLTVLVDSHWTERVYLMDPSRLRDGPLHPSPKGILVVRCHAGPGPGGVQFNMRRARSCG